MISTLLLAILVLSVPGAAQPEVTLGLGANSQFSKDGTVSIPVTLSPGTENGIAALQFEIAFNPAQLQFTAVEPGQSAIDAAKSTHASALRPGTARFIVAGLNRNVMGNGVIAWIRFATLPGSTPPFTTTVSGVVLSDPYGNAVDAHVNPDTLTIDPAASIALTSDTRPDVSGSGADLLVRYRALIFAALLVMGAMYLARRAPRKGRVR